MIGAKHPGGTRVREAGLRQVVRSLVRGLWLLGMMLMGQGALAQAQLEPAASRIRDRGEALEVTLQLSAAVPWRIFTLDAPMRVVFDFGQASLPTNADRRLRQSDRVTALQMGPVQPGWSRLVLELNAPMALESAGMTTAGGKGRLVARFAPTSAAAFARGTGAGPDPDWARRRPFQSLGAPEKGGPLRILLDPGHGGIDPGAERDGVVESHLMLIFAQEVRAELVKAGYQVRLTRQDDTFVPLETRVAMAHDLGADLFISLHADALAEGRAWGTTVHTLSRSATDEASRKLAERHDRADLLSGVDLSDSDDVVADVLMDLARMETQPRSEALADAIVAQLRQAGLPLNTRPRRAAGYSVLKAPDIPSVLVETGFLSSPRDRRNLVNPVFRARLAQSLAGAVQAWQSQDAALAGLRRR